MHRSSRTLRLRKAVSGKRFTSVVAGSLAAALGAGLIAAGATATATGAAAAPNANDMMDAALYPQSVAAQGTTNAPSADGLKVTVGKAVSITTDAAGNEGIKALVTNTQVSGTGSGTVTVPIGASKATNTGSFGNPTVENDAIVYNVNSQAGDVTNYHSSAGMFDGQAAVSLNVEAWLDGQPISPNKLVHVTGNVKINYTFTNNTSVPTEITYKNGQGETVTELVPIQVPLAGSFAATFGDGWGNIVAPWALTGMSNVGQQLNGTVIMIPPLGGQTETLSMTARAENATMPNSTTTFIPLDLDAMSGGLVTGVLPEADAVIGDLNQIVQTAPQQLVFYQQLLAKYAAVAADINNQYVKPLVKTVEGINITPAQLNTAIDIGELGADALAALFDVQAFIARANAFGARLASGILANDVVPLMQGFASAIDTLAKALANNATGVQAAIEAIEAGALDVTTLVNEGITFLGKVCTNPQATNVQAIAAAAGTGKQGKGLSANASALLALGTNLDVKNAALFGGFANLILPKQQVNAEEYATCVQNIDGLEAFISSMSDPNNGFFQFLEKIQAFMANADKPGSPLMNAEDTVASIAALVPQFAQVLNNPNVQTCPATGSIRTCGANAYFRMISGRNGDIAAAITNNVVPAIDGLKRYTPTVVNLLNLVKGAVAKAGEFVDTIPGTLQGFAAKLGAAEPTVQNIANEAASITDKLAILTASLVKMVEMQQAGKGIPYGNATGPAGTTNTLAAWQINQYGAGDYGQQAVLSLAIALVIFLVVGGVGTAIYLRKRPHRR